MTIDEKCENQEFNQSFNYSHQMYKCKTKDYCPYKFEQHNEKGQPTGTYFCIERYFIKDLDKEDLK